MVIDMDSSSSRESESEVDKNMLSSTESKNEL